MSDYPKMPGVRPSSPDTAMEAALSVAEAALSREAAARVFIHERKHFGATSDEVADAHGWERYSSRPRLSTMKARGEIVDSGERRLGASGRRQAVWVVPEFGPTLPEGPQDSLPGILDAA